MLLIGFLGLLGLVLVSSAFVKSPSSGAALVLFIFTVETLFVELPPLSLGLNVYAPDIIFVILFSAAILRYLGGRARFTRTRLAVLAMVFLFMVGLARGVATFGIKEAGLASRALFYLYAGTLYFSSFNFRRREQRRLVEMWLHAALVLVAIAVFRWIATAMGLEIAASWEDMETSPMRVLNAGQTMFLCMAFFFCIVLVSVKRASPLQKAMVYVLPPVILLLQHRTVWIVLFFGLMWLFSKQTRQLRRILIAAVGLLILAIPLIFFVFDSSFVAETMMASATDPSTLIWRIAGWRQLLMDRKATPVDYLIGQPAGTDQSRVIGTTVVDANPHNFYVQTFLCEGIAGILVLLWLYVARIRKFRKSPKRVFLQRTYFPERMWAMFLCAQMLFFLAYSPSYDQTLVLGMAVGIGSTQLCVRSRMRTRLRAPMPSAVEGLA